MSNKLTYPFEAAAKATSYILELLRPHCIRIHHAGSIRRLRYQAGDIEIVCESKKEFIQTGLFPEEGQWLVSKDFSEALAIITDEVIKGNVSGRYMQIKTTSKKCPGILLDLFMPQPDDYYRMLAIRTGSAEYAHHVIAAAWKRKGWVGIKETGLRKISDCYFTTDKKDKKTYHLKPGITKPQLPPVWQSEKEFFNWLGIEYKEPEHREFNKPVNEAL